MNAIDIYTLFHLQHEGQEKEFKDFFSNLYHITKVAFVIQTDKPWYQLEFEIDKIDLQYEDVFGYQTCADTLRIWPHGTDVNTGPLVALILLTYMCVSNNRQIMDSGKNK